MPQHSNERSPRRRQKKGHEKIIEGIIVENVPKVGREIVTKVQETQRVPNRIHPRWDYPKQILIKLTTSNTKNTNIKSSKKKKKKKEITRKGISIRKPADLSLENLHARREWQDMLKVMKEENLQPRLPYPARISFKYEGEIKSFTKKQKLRESSTTKPALQQMLKDLL